MKECSKRGGGKGRGIKGSGLSREVGNTKEKLELYGSDGMFRVIVDVGDLARFGNVSHCKGRRIVLGGFVRIVGLGLEWVGEFGRDTVVGRGHGEKRDSRRRIEEGVITKDVCKVIV